MAKIRKAKFTKDVFRDGAKLHAAGDVKDLTPETERCVARGQAEVIEVDAKPRPSERQIKAARKAVLEAKQVVENAEAELVDAKDKDRAKAEETLKAAWDELEAAEAELKTLEGAE